MNTLSCAGKSDALRNTSHVATSNSRHFAIPRWAIFVIIGLLVVIVRAPYLGDPAADYDEQLYSVIGQGWLDGELPYRDRWDRKPPGLFALYALMHAIGGATPLAYQIPGLLCTIASAFFVFSFARKMGTEFGALVVTTLFVFNLPLFILHLGQSETFLMPLLLAQLGMFHTAFRSSDLRKVHALFGAIMLSAGIALQIKYSVLPFCMMFALLALIRLRQIGQYWRAIALKMIGYAGLGILPTGIAIGYFASKGAFSEFWFANFLSILQRAPLEPDLVARYTIHITVAAFPLILFACLGFITYRQQATAQDWRLFGLSAAFAVAGAVALLMLGHAFIHYFGPLLPFLCILAAPFFSYWRSHRLFAALAVGLAIICASFPEQMERTRSGRSATATLSAAIKTRVPEDECLLVFDGPSSLYYLADRCIPTRMVFPDHLTNVREINALGIDVVAETSRILSTRPGAIVITDGMADPHINQNTAMLVTQALNGSYTKTDSAFLYPRNLELYVRSDLLEPEIDGAAD